MNLFDLMAREHQRIARELDRCIVAPDSSHLTGTDRRAVRAVCDYLMAQQKAVFPQWIMLTPDGADEPVQWHDRMKVHALVALAQCERGDHTTVALHVLQRAWLIHGEYEQGRLRTAFEKIFSADELRQLGGSMQLELVEPHDRDHRGSFGRAVRAWRHLVRQVQSGRRRALPALQKAVFVYRAT